MTQKIYSPSAPITQPIHMSQKKYEEWYQHSIENPEEFWAERAKQFIHWYTPWDTVMTGGFESGEVTWFKGAKLNVAYNCLDRHLPTLATKTALIWEGDDPSLSKTFTYQELHDEVSRFANVLKSQGIQKGNRICIYLPMIPEAIIAMIASARVGAIHSIVFAGFSAESLKNRILDADCCLVITANEGIRANKILPLKINVDKALEACPKVNKVIVVKRTNHDTPWNTTRDHWYHDLMKEADYHSPAEIMDALDPFFILYTSGSTGKPKGILHSTAGYVVYAAMTFYYIFNYEIGEVYWCTADIGWITGHTYSVYGPLLNGATILIYEGGPNFPTPARFWEVIDKHNVNIFYTAPTAIRALRREGDEWLQHTSRRSLRLLGSVGEPINPDAWEWYYHEVGRRRCPIVDTWWQTETGGIMISALPYATPLKPGSAAWPFFGVVPAILDEQAKRLPAGKMGSLVITKPWPGMMQTIYGDHARFLSYFTQPPGCYLTGDQAYQDAEGYFWISGRSDDVIKVSGHRIGTLEVESALIRHQAVAETAVVAIPDEIKGQSIYAYVNLKPTITASPELQKELQQTVRDEIGAIAVPQHIQWVDELPKTRSGKIMRRLLRKIAMNETELGDLSTLADPTVIQALIKK